jgi:hypothetical protein
VELDKSKATFAITRSGRNPSVAGWWAKARPTIVLALLSGCVTDTWRLRDLTFVSAWVIDQRDIPPSDYRFGPNPKLKRLLLVIAFKSLHGKDLYQYAENSDYNMAVKVSICSYGGFDRRKLIDAYPYIYGDRGQVMQDENPVMTDASRDRTFHIYLLMSGGETCDLAGCKPFPYDLMKTPEDLCLYLDGGAFQILFPAFQSNLIVVPKSAVAAAIRNPHRHLE